MKTIVLITHENIGAELLKIVTQTYETLPLPTIVITVRSDSNSDEVLAKLHALAKAKATNESFLVLADMYGSTPCNLALELQIYPNIEVVSGLNLPMLMKVMNYSHLGLSELAQKAICGGRDGVIDCTSPKAYHLSSGSARSA